MSQHDMDFLDGNGTTVLADLNLAVKALASNSSGATEPATTYAFQPWADTANDLFKIRNAANTAWLSVFQLSTGKPVDVGYATVASSATPDIFGAAGDTINYTGTATATGFANAEYAGQKRTLIIASYGAKFTLGANVTMSGFSSGYTYTCYPGMVVDVIALTTTTFLLYVHPYSSQWNLPTLYNTTNVAASTTNYGNFTISRNQCFGGLLVAQDPTTAGIQTVLGIAIGEGANSPPASAFTAGANANGCSNEYTTNCAGQIAADLANARLAMYTYPPSNANLSWRMNFMYTLL